MNPLAPLVNELQAKLIEQASNSLILTLNKALLKIQKQHRKNPELPSILATVNVNCVAVTLGKVIASTCFHNETGPEGAKQLLETLIPGIEHEVERAFYNIEAAGFEPNTPLVIQ